MLESEGHPMSLEPATNRIKVEKAELRVPRLKLKPRQRRRQRTKMIKAALSFARIYLWELANSKMTQISVLTLITRSIVQEVEGRAAPGLQRSLTPRTDVHVGVIGAIPERTPPIVLYMNMIAGVAQGTIPERTSL